MKEMLNNQMNARVKLPASSSEMDSIPIIHRTASKAIRTGWVAGRRSTNEETIAREREILRSELGQVASTSEFV